MAMKKDGIDQTCFLPFGNSQYIRCRGQCCYFALHFLISIGYIYVLLGETPTLVLDLFVTILIFLLFSCLVRIPNIFYMVTFTRYRIVKYVHSFHKLTVDCFCWMIIILLYGLYLIKSHLYPSSAFNDGLLLQNPKTVVKTKTIMYILYVFHFWVLSI